eukprot:461851-Prorocentrum_minimum.AAC.5
MTSSSATSRYSHRLSHGVSSPEEVRRSLGTSSSSSTSSVRALPTPRTSDEGRRGAINKGGSVSTVCKTKPASSASVSSVTGGARNKNGVRLPVSQPAPKAPPVGTCTPPRPAAVLRRGDVVATKGSSTLVTAQLRAQRSSTSSAGGQPTTAAVWRYITKHVYIQILSLIRIRELQLSICVMLLHAPRRHPSGHRVLRCGIVRSSSVRASEGAPPLLPASSTEQSTATTADEPSSLFTTTSDKNEDDAVSSNGGDEEEAALMILRQDPPPTASPTLVIGRGCDAAAAADDDDDDDDHDDDAVNVQYRQHAPDSSCDAPAGSTCISTTNDKRVTDKNVSARTTISDATAAATGLSSVSRPLVLLQQCFYSKVP